MDKIKRMINRYLEEISLVSTDQEATLGNEWRDISNDVINKSIVAGKVNKSRCLTGCKGEIKCKQDCDLRATTLVIRSLQSGITRCRNDKRCIKSIATRIINVAERGDEKIKKYGFGTPYLATAIAFANRMGFEAR